MLRLDDVLLDDAAALDRSGLLRGLDAIHLAGARALGDALTELMTYDRRMAEASATIGLAVVAPV